jgi:aerobic-type carbon monoxide dehydrogenase small subunit (CoxS/CutS family)
MKEMVRFIVNGEPVEMELDSERLLLWVLRCDLGLTGTKYGCGAGLCGACTVIVEGEAMRSCQTPAKYVHGKEVLTIEGLLAGGMLHALQRAFVKHDAMQCGFCTPGMIMNAYGFLSANAHPTRAEIIGAMDHNLCRCGTHQRIVEAIEEAAREVRDQE